MIREAIAKLVARQDLTEAESVAVMEELMTGEATAAQVGAFLVGLRFKGETVDELTGMVRVMRAKALRVDAGVDVLDVVSTGGGSFDPLNISTAAALVCAAAGVPVAKHGNRGFTSAAGAADVLEALGARLELTPEQVAACIERSGFGFLFAPSFHPSMRFVGPARREIGVRTVFNSLGPLTNPAGARHQLLGVGDAALAEKVAQVLSRLGTGKALVVHGEDGLDEVSLAAPTMVREVVGKEMRAYSLTAADAGFASIPVEAVRSGTASQNAERIRAVFSGDTGPDRDYILVNAGAALVAAERASDLREGVALARQAVDTGAATRTLDSFVETTNSFGPAS
jgi:anthranilate phosphoribosyltransferase